MTTTLDTYAQAKRSADRQRCLRHPDKRLIVQHSQEQGYFLKCGECGLEPPVLGKYYAGADKEWNMTQAETRKLATRGQEPLPLTVNTIRSIMNVGKATDTEIRAFIAYCMGVDANPYTHEAYLIKYDEGRPANVVLSLQWYLKRASHNPAYQSYQSGVIVKREGEGYVDMVGAVVLPGDTLFGGWCKVYKKDAPAFERRVTLSEYDRRQAQWKTMPATMIEKVAIVQAVRRAFPDEFQAEEQAAMPLPVVLEGDVPEPQQAPPALTPAPVQAEAPEDRPAPTPGPAQSAFDPVGKDRGTVLHQLIQVEKKAKNRAEVAGICGLASEKDLENQQPVWIYQTVQAYRS